MTDAMAVFRGLKEAYLRYFDSPFDLRFDELVEERRALLDRDGVLYRDPLIEPQPPYIGSRHDVVAAASAALSGAAGWSPQAIADLGQFAATGLFSTTGAAPIELYRHQVEMLQISSAERRDAVILTGTGSGKTESIYLPVFASLIRESMNWPEAPAAPRNDWWDMTPQPGQGARTRHPRIGQRAHEQGARLPGVRALVMYPLNALAEDQMTRLRQSLDSNAVRDWLRNNRKGNRFWFGRYIGSTPVPGRPSSDDAVNRLRDAMKKLAETARTARAAGHGDAERFFPRLDGGEMWSRWDMQDAPPDILVTNYSMLNIMLMRDVETPIFASTRDWLASSPENVFHLVVDELHSYRGTPGTEVAYIIRVLLDRIGLHPDHPQLRILASSASLGSDDVKAQEYLSQFFGTSRAFGFVRGGATPIPAGAIGRLRGLAGTFAQLGQAIEADVEADINDSIDSLSDASGSPRPSATLSLENRLGEALGVAGIPDAVRAACNSGSDEQPVVRPLTPGRIGARLFPEAEPHVAASAGQGIVSSLALARNGAGAPLLPLREHVFFRNVQGIWACTNPGCTGVTRVEADIPVGKLFDRAVTTCQCGSRVLEMLYCEPCGDVFLGGYKRDLRNNAWSLVPDDPNIEKAPDHSASDRTYFNYAVYWPSRTAAGLRAPQKDHWDQDGVRRSWHRARYDHLTGELELARNQQSATGWIYYVKRLHEPNAAVVALTTPSAQNERPAVCPRCEANWAKLASAAPIRTQRTGFQKTAQVLTDALLREIAPVTEGADHAVEDSRRKLVLFSDSRQDAAKLAVGVAKSHWLDAMRQVLVEGVSDEARGILAFDRRLRMEALTAEEERLADAFAAARQEAASAMMAVQLGQGARPSRLGGYTNQALKDKVLAEARDGVLPIRSMQDQAERKLLANGMNPGGVDRSVTWTDLDHQTGDWPRLFDWQLDPPAFKQVLTPDEIEHRRRIGNAEREAIAESIFSGGRRDFESLKLGVVTFDPQFRPANDDVLQQTAESCIRLLGKRRRIDTHRATADRNDLPRYISDYVTSVANLNARDATSLLQEVLGLMTRSRVYNQGILEFDRLFVRRPGENYFQCGICSRVHLHRSGGVCSNCTAPLGTPLRIGVDDAREGVDYYTWLATQAGPVFRLNCAEMTGQTDKVVAKDRQRLFQNVPIGDEFGLTDNLDLLSVTTTMEAGVDIGSLLAAMMANMPPMRFNYQQRVGRAGRRGAAVSIALTLCRGRSHDDYYFQRPDRITADPPPPPYVDTNRRQILQRVLNKEVLRAAFTELNLFATPDGDSVHGEFGRANAWTNPPDQQPAGYAGTTVAEIIQEWIDTHPNEVEHACDTLLLGTVMSNDPASRTESLDFVRTQLVQRITGASQDITLVQDALSERLANHGLLPMFGFPTRARNLYHSRPRRWPARDVVDRDLELAVSMFAPGAETVKERAIHTSIGVVRYFPQGQMVEEDPDPLGPPVTVGVCGNCQHVETVNLAGGPCPTCGAPEGDGDRQYRLLDLRQPKGFTSYYTGARDYDGAFEFVPRAARPKVGRPQFAINPHLNFEVGSGDEGRLYVINDNGGRLYELVRISQNSHAMVDVGAMQSAEQKSAAAENRRARQVAPNPIGQPVRCALAAISRTDMMLLGIRDFGTGRGADPRTPQGRAALYSLSFMLRRAAAVLLDIQDHELKSGIRSVEDVATQVTGQVFLCDTLENGAGYSTYLGQPPVAEKLLRMICEPGHKDFFERLEDGTHSDACDTSCPDCLRSYSNLQYHNLLDWRLAADLAALALDANVTISLSSPRWSRVVDKAATTLLNARPGHRRLTIAGLPAIANGTDVKIITHPLWLTGPGVNPCRDIARAWNEAERVHGLHIDPEASFVSVFKALRQPL
ncbi:DEAD/DEAH box helicase [Bradyrhizobium manausense]|uniref:DEAD/DEAH box helicase n=1 Tax=Bradyrhizobium manausense TaxID=989370 RepID=UPI001BAAE4DD|nr:DEAD/DEAH box helicase [Bradyrhizobium manausense]MBR0793046.1 DEAD/DEAH box helicase [Bradyrhizobium manausense]